VLRSEMTSDSPFQASRAAYGAIGVLGK